MDFKDYCKQHSDLIYKKILNYLPKKEPQKHYQMVREYTERRGKYARPNLALLWCELYGGKVKDIFLPACAIQLAEDWILMHDDWEDNNEMRRGKPAMHKLYGDVFAINAGDAAHMIMWQIMHQASKIPNEKIGENLYQKFSDVLLVTAEGQYYDMRLARSKAIDKFSLKDYWQSIHAKAGYYSVYGPMQLGAIAADCPDKVINGIKKYGLLVGNAFQVKDDILDCISTAEILGKAIGTDIYEGSKTAILWHFARHASKVDLKIVKEIYAKKREDKTLAEVKLVIKLFQKTGSIAYAEELVDSLSKQALEEFEEQTKDIPENEMKKTARDAIIRMTAREK